MHRQIDQLSTIAIAALACVLMGAAVPAKSAPSQNVTISNPGFADYNGFRIVVAPSGQATAVDAAGSASLLLRSDLSQPLFDDLAAARAAGVASKSCSAPLSGLATTTVQINQMIDVAWNGQRWTSLECASEPSLQRVLQDAMAIRSALYVQAYRKRTVIVFVGQNGADVQPFVPNSLSPSGTLQLGNIALDHFTTGGFESTTFRAGASVLTNPYNGSMPSTTSWGTLPYSNPYTPLPSGSVTFDNPFSGLPGSSIVNDSPFDGNPYNGSPFSGGP